jgi:hypothetical protein
VRLSRWRVESHGCRRRGCRCQYRLHRHRGSAMTCRRKADRVGGDRGLLHEMRDETGTGDETGVRTAGSGVAAEDQHDRADHGSAQRSRQGGSRQGFAVSPAITQVSRTGRALPDQEDLTCSFAPALEWLDARGRSLQPVPGGTVNAGQVDAATPTEPPPRDRHQSRSGPVPVRRSPQCPPGCHIRRSASCLRCTTSRRSICWDERAPHRSALSVPAEPSGRAGSAYQSGRLPRNGPEPISPKMSEFNGA